MFDRLVEGKMLVDNGIECPAQLKFYVGGV